jgi:hypothetical protein
MTSDERALTGSHEDVMRWAAQPQLSIADALPAFEQHDLCGFDLLEIDENLLESWGIDVSRNPGLARVRY